MSGLNTILSPFMDFYCTHKRRKLRKVVARHWRKINFPPKEKIKKISGTFIYQTPPDYPGVPAQQWKTQDWIKEFTRLKKIGIDTIIHNGAIAETTTGKWYVFYKISKDSLKNFKEVKKRRGFNPIINPCLDYVVQAAEQCEMNLHLGLFNVLDKWFSNPTRKFVELTQKHEITTAKDLINLYGEMECVKGWYISPEIMWLLHGFYKKLNLYDFLQPICKFLKSETPKKQIGISPGTNYYRIAKNTIYNFWVNTLKNSGVDFLYPQDSVGTLTNLPDKTIWNLWKRIAEASDVKLWANCETFERVSFKLPNPLYAAPINRLIMQLESVSPFVEKVITWEAMYFLNPSGATGGKELHDQYKNYFIL